MSSPYTICDYFSHNCPCGKRYFFYRKRKSLTPCENGFLIGTSSASEFCLNKKTSVSNNGYNRMYASVSAKNNSAAFAEREILFVQNCTMM